MTANHFLWAFLALLFVASCTEPFTPELGDLDRLVVVDGMVTNAPGPYLVRLSYSGDIFEPIPNARVFITEEGGARYSLEEQAGGEYRTDSAAFRGEVGKAYKLEVELANGQSYVSPFMEILDNPGIDTVETEAQVRYFDDVQREIPGYEFQISTRPDEGRDHFYLWKMEGTYKYQAEFLTYYIYSDSLIPVAEPDQFDYYSCYKTDPIDQKATGSTRGFDQKRIVRKPLLFITGDDRKLSRRYSLLVQQLAVNEQTYEFWDGVIGQSGSSTSLFNTQPYLIKGNVVNAQDSSEIVLGNFTVAGVSEKRFFFNRPTEFNVTYPDCFLDPEAYEALINSPNLQGTFFITTAPDSSLAISGMGCIDCRELGGDTTAPDWWVE